MADEVSREMIVHQEQRICISIVIYCDILQRVGMGSNTNIKQQRYFLM